MASLHLAQKILDIIWPIGSIYLSDNATNPNTKFGGTWVKLSGGFIYGSVATSGNSYSTGNGTGTSTSNHTLTINQIPNHNHSIHVAGTSLDANGDTVFRAQTGVGSNGGNFWNIGLARTGVGSHDAGITGTGGGQGHSHGIPYIGCSIWRRTA